MSKNSLDWRKLLVEGVVIVASILMAFAIDAWWNARQQVLEARDQANSVVAELQANRAVLEQQEQFLNHSLSVTRDFLTKLGPEPALIDVEEVAKLVDGMYSAPTFSLERSATQSFLSSGQLNGPGWDAVRNSLSELGSRFSSAEAATLELRSLRPGINGVLEKHISMLEVVRGHPTMADAAASRFPSDLPALLSDRQLEARISGYAVRTAVNRAFVEDMLDRIDLLTNQIETELSR